MSRPFTPVITLISYMFLLAGLIYLSCPGDNAFLERGTTKSGFFEAMH
jgi:hypothetical protein